MRSLLSPMIAPVFLGFLLFSTPARQCGADEIPIAAIDHQGPVDFQKEVLPILRKNCLACHNSTDAEGDLILETPEAMLTGGAEGPAIVKGNGAESYMLQLAAHQVEPVMPPEDNGVEAGNLTSEELGILKLWIDQGAEGSVMSGADVTFEQLPAGINPVYGLALSDDGQTLAASRANQIFLYHLPSQRELGRLTDPALIEQGIYQNPGVAHLDLVQSIAFSPDRNWLASGGYRNVKLWRRQPIGVDKDIDLGAPVLSFAASRDGARIAALLQSGQIKMVATETGEVVGELGPVPDAKKLALSTDGSMLAVASESRLEWWNVNESPTQQASAELEGGVRQLEWFQAGSQLVVAGNDHVLRLVEAMPAEGDQPAAFNIKQTFTGHQAEVTAVRTWAEGGGLASSDASGQIIRWNLENASPLQKMDHGAPVRSLAVAADQQRLMSFGDTQTSRCWNLENGKAVLQKDGDFQLDVVAQHAKFGGDLSNRLVELAKQDLDAAQKQKTAEEENEKKAKEALTKSTEDQTAKKKAADDTGKAKADADAVLVASQSKLKELETGIAAAEKTRVESEAREKELAASTTQMEKELADKMAMLTKLKEELVSTQKMRQEAVAKKQELEKTMPTVQQEVKTSEEQAKKAGEAAQKASDELVASDRALMGAKRTAERAAESVARATEQIPVREKQVAAAEEVQKERQAEATEAQSAFQQQRAAYTAARFLPETHVALTLTDAKLTAWSISTGVPMFSEALPNECLPQVVSDAQGYAWLASDKHLQRVRVTEGWSLARTVGSVRGESPFSDRVTALDFSPDGQMLAAGGGVPSRSGEILLLNVEDGRVLSKVADPHSDVVLCLRFSPDGESLASAATDRFMKTFEVATGKLIRGFEGHTHHVQGVAWSADGRTLATSGSDQVIKVWNALTGDQLRTIQGFGKELTGVSFLGLSREVAASGGDRQVYLKNVDNGGNVRQMGGFPDYVYCVDASFDGNIIVGAGQDSVVRVWQRDGKVVVEFAPPTTP